MTEHTLTADALAERFFGSALGAVELMSVYVGDRLGWYRALVDDGPATAPRLAERTSTHPRYAREWLEQQAVSGLLTVTSDASVVDGDARVYSIPPATVEVMTGEGSVNYLAPLARMFGGVAPLLPALLGAYRDGGGVSWASMGVDARESQSDMNRPWFENHLADALSRADDLHATLSRPGAAVLDVGCGGGWSTIALARAYPSATFHGIDIDEATVAMARDNVTRAGLADRIHVTCADAAEPLPGPFTAAFAFECVHDMPQPVGVLSSVRTALAPGAPVVVMDEAAAETFAPDGDEVERLLYGFSLFVCLPDSMSHDPTVATGTVIREATVRQIASSAGYASVDVLPIDDFGFWRFYRLGTGAPVEQT